MFKPRHTAGKLFALYLKAPAHPAKIRLQNWLGRRAAFQHILLQNQEGILFQLPANDWITRIMLLEGGYEQGSLALAKSIMQQGGLMVDIGANFGLYSCAIAATCKQATLVAVEPNYKMIPVLLQNIYLNQATGRVSVYHTALTGNGSFVTLAQPASDNMGTTQTLQGHSGLLNIGSCTLNALLKARGNPTVKLIKIDIEGNEFDVFEKFDFDACLVENILLEFNHLSPIGLEDLCVFFAAKGFAAFNIAGKPLQGKVPIMENNIWFKK